MTKETLKIATIEELGKLVSTNIINENLGFISNVAKAQETKNNLVQNIFFDYLANKSEYKKLMIELGYIEENVKNKDIAKFYFNSQIKIIGSRLFDLYGIEIKSNDKGYSLINTKKSIEGQNIIKGTKEYLKNTFVLVDLISTNNLKMRIKLLDFSTLKSILTNLLELIEGKTVKQLINEIDTNLDDISYLKALKAILRQVKKESKSNLTFDVKSLTKISDIDSLMELLKDRKNELLNTPVSGVEKEEEVKEDTTITETFEIEE